MSSFYSEKNVGVCQKRDFELVASTLTSCCGPTCEAILTKFCAKLVHHLGYHPCKFHRSEAKLSPKFPHPPFYPEIASIGEVVVKRELMSTSSGYISGTAGPILLKFCMGLPLDKVYLL